MYAIEIEGLGKTFVGKKMRRVEALADLCLTVASGEVFGFLGPNGAGKSTTIKTLLGLITPTAGSAKVCGISVSDAAARMHVGYLPENPAFYDYLTGREYLNFVGRAFEMAPAAIGKESTRVLEMLELAGAADRPIRSYSKGMVQRLGLAQAMLHDPDLYILDEPMSGLDPLGRSLVKEIILDLKQQRKTVFFSTHITADVEMVCDRVGVIVGGRLQAVAQVNDILKDGIEGYLVQVGECPEELARYVTGVKPNGFRDLYVPRSDLSKAMALLAAAGSAIELIEPKRKDLEAFFLDIVAKSHP